jgi:hypothetical protein
MASLGDSMVWNSTVSLSPTAKTATSKCSLSCFPMSIPSSGRSHQQTLCVFGVLFRFMKWVYFCCCQFIQIYIDIDNVSLCLLLLICSKPTIILKTIRKGALLFDSGLSVYYQKCFGNVKPKLPPPSSWRHILDLWAWLGIYAVALSFCNICSP